jgi:hypothetical protein
MKKLLTMTLVCITLISALSLADSSNDKSKPLVSEPMQPIDYRSYTGFKIQPNKDGKITMQVYHMKMEDKDMFWYFVQYCIYGKTVSTCSYLSSNGWIEGKIAGNNWIVKSNNFSVNAGKNNAKIKSDSINAILNIE